MKNKLLLTKTFKREADHSPSVLKHSAQHVLHLGRLLHSHHTADAPGLGAMLKASKILSLGGNDLTGLIPTTETCRIKSREGENSPTVSTPNLTSLQMGLYRQKNKECFQVPVI